MPLRVGEVAGPAAADVRRAVTAAPVWSNGTIDPGEAEQFDKQCGVDCLAVAVGNVHGHYAGTPVLDAARRLGADGVLARPDLLRQGLVDDGDRSRAGAAGCARRTYVIPPPRNGEPTT